MSFGFERKPAQRPRFRRSVKAEAWFYSLLESAKRADVEPKLYLLP